MKCVTEIIGKREMALWEKSGGYLLNPTSSEAASMVGPPNSETKINHLVRNPDVPNCKPVPAGSHTWACGLYSERARLVSFRS